MDADTFRSVLGRFASGVTIITARTPDGDDRGMTVSAFCSVSLDPPLVLFCVDRAAELHPVLDVGVHVGVSILSRDMERYSRRFADADARIQRFEGVGFARGERGVVLVDDALAHLECRVTERHEAGDHTIFVAAVERARPLDGEPEPLLYFRGGYALLRP